MTHQNKIILSVTANSKYINHVYVLVKSLYFFSPDIVIYVYLVNTPDTEDSILKQLNPNCVIFHVKNENVNTKKCLIAGESTGISYEVLLNERSRFSSSEGQFSMNYKFISICELLKNYMSNGDILIHLDADTIVNNDIRNAVELQNILDIAMYYNKEGLMEAGIHIIKKTQKSIKLYDTLLKLMMPVLYGNLKITEADEYFLDETLAVTDANILKLGITFKDDGPNFNNNSYFISGHSNTKFSKEYIKIHKQFMI